MRVLKSLKDQPLLQGKLWVLESENKIQIAR